MNTPSLIAAKIYVFCDAGLGNRINALAFGKHIAAKLGMEMVVYWPTNNWFGAEYQDIFENNVNVINQPIHLIDFKSMNCIGVLHDEIPRQFMGGIDTRFISDFSTESSFFEFITDSKKDLFLHTVLIPSWLSGIEYGQSLRSIKFNRRVINAAGSFIGTIPRNGFYGLHLRRTDLTAGLDDSEIFDLISSNPNSEFFVCSDCQNAERLANLHPNCRSYPKRSYVQKRAQDASWNALTNDDSGRQYHGNIIRGAQASFEGAIDLLVLAHSTVIGKSGSTFQSLAISIGEYAKIFPTDFMPRIDCYSYTYEKRRFKSGNIGFKDAVQVLEYYCGSKVPSRSIELLFSALYSFSDHDWVRLATECSNMLLNKQQIELAVPAIAFLSIDRVGSSKVQNAKLSLDILLDHLVRQKELIRPSQGQALDLSWDFRTKGI